MKERHAQGDPRAQRLLRRQSAAPDAIELVVAGAATAPARRKAALGWMRRVLFAPDWRVENLPRLRDLVDQRLTALRQRMLGAEEGWVEDPRDAWRRADDARTLHTSSFLTRAHDLHRLRWMLVGSAATRRSTDEVVKFLGDARRREVAQARRARRARGRAREGRQAEDREARAVDRRRGKLSAKAQAARDAGRQGSRRARSRDLPDGSLAMDWSYLCKQMAADLEVGAPAALAKLDDSARAGRRRRARARIVEVGSTANQQRDRRRCRALVDVARRRTQAAPRAAEHARAPCSRDRLAAARSQGEGRRRSSASSRRRRRAACSSTSRRTSYYTDTTDDAILDYLTVEPLQRATARTRSS